MTAAARQDAYPHLGRDLRFFPLGVEEPKVLTRAEIDTYNERGYLFPFDVFNEAEISEIRRYFDGLLADALAAGWDSYEITNWHKTCRGVWDIVTHPKLVAFAADMLGETVICRHSHFFCKLPGDGKRVSWHQDASYWPLSPSRVVSIWLAIDDATEDNGALQVIPRSHIDAQVPFFDSDASESNVLGQTVRNPTSHGDAPVSLAMKAGQISLHSDWLLHSSEPNRSAERRCGLALRYLSADVRAFNGWNAHSVICQGSDPSGHWANHPRPDGETIPRRH